VEALDLAGTAMPASVAKSYADRLRADEAILLRGDVGVKPYAVLSSIAGSAIADADLVPALPPTSPSIHLGDENGPDCLYARLFVQDVDVETADIRVTETATGTLAVHAHFEGISIPATSEYAMSCVNGTSPFNIVAGELTADGTMSVAADGTVSFANLSYHWNGVYYNSSSPPPSAIEDLLFSDSKALGDIVTSSVAIAMQPLVASTKNGRVLAATEVWLPGAPDVTDPSGVFVLVSQNGDRVSERKVNSTLTANIDEIDLDESGATADAIERANAQLAAGESVLVVGYRYSSGGKKGRSANQFWTKAPVPQQ
jgi:hypothetical protein